VRRRRDLLFTPADPVTFVLPESPGSQPFRPALYIFALCAARIDPIAALREE
jgi:hypothetical protein